MEITAIRSRFIQESLRKALNGGDHLLAWMTACEFRKYFQWFRDSLPDADRRLIANQLATLEELCRTGGRASEKTSAHADRVRHQLQETTLA